MVINDIEYAHVYDVVHPERDLYSGWGRYPELLRLVPGFTGQVRMTGMGDIYGRFDEVTKGECIRGVLQEGWHLLESHTFPKVVEAAAADYTASEKYVLTGLPCGIFSTLRDCRLMDNALMDTILETENVKLFLDRVINFAVTAMDISVKKGVNGMIVYDDLGMQHSLFFSPDVFRKLFKPFYKRLGDELHSRGLDYIVHSCGKVYELIEDFIEAGVDVFQFDQPELTGSEILAKEFGHKAAFYCPVDIQAVMATGNRTLITETALNMVNSFKSVGGSLIAMDYGAWHDLNVPDEWQQWARDVIVENANL